MTTDPLDLLGALDRAVDQVRELRLVHPYDEPYDLDGDEWRPAPDLSVGNVALAINDRLRRCAYCDKALHMGAGVVTHTPLPHVSVIRDHYHPECVDIP